MPQLPAGDGRPAWRELGDREFSALWSTHFSVPTPGTPVRAYRIPDSFDERQPEMQPLLVEFHALLLKAFRACLPQGRKMYALDYHHPSYEFDPHIAFETGSGDERYWPVTVLPDGDDTIYVADDQSFGTSAEWNPPSLAFFGAALLARLDEELPRLLERWEHT